jgi:chemotaxis protein MotB
MSRQRGGHHGGAWKVAYADFVTAMMALFLVLWLTSQDQKIRDAVERAFNHPFSSPTERSTGIIPNENMQAVRSGDGRSPFASKVELEILRRLNDDLLQSLQASDGIAKSSVALEMTPDGLRISVFDRAQRAIFEPNSSALTRYGKWVLTTLAWHISRYSSFLIEVEGHTDKSRVPKESPDDWDLTATRANTARRLLLDQGVKPTQIRRVAGYADTMPLADREPYDEANRRVTVLLKVSHTKFF